MDRVVGHLMWYRSGQVFSKMFGKNPWIVTNPAVCAVHLKHARTLATEIKNHRNLWQLSAEQLGSHADIPVGFSNYH